LAHQHANIMTSTLNLSVLALVLGIAILSVASTVITPASPSTHDQGPVKTFDPLKLAKDTTAREPFLDPTALFSDQVYLVRPLDTGANGTVRNARFVGGEQALVNHLKTKVLEHIAPGIGWLKPPVVQFSVDASGSPTQVELVKTSGNAALDEALVRIFQEMPRWEPATTANGQAVAQAFRFNVGQGGC
jgi:TonB family protein